MTIVTIELLPWQSQKSVWVTLSAGHRGLCEPPGLVVDDDRGGDLVLQRVHDLAELGEVFHQGILLVELVAGNEDLRRTTVDGGHSGSWKMFVKVRSLATNDFSGILQNSCKFCVVLLKMHLNGRKLKQGWLYYFASSPILEEKVDRFETNVP